MTNPDLPKINLCSPESFSKLKMPSIPLTDEELELELPSAPKHLLNKKLGKSIFAESFAANMPSNQNDNSEAALDRYLGIKPKFVEKKISNNVQNTSYPVLPFNGTCKDDDSDGSSAGGSSSCGSNEAFLPNHFQVRQQQQQQTIPVEPNTFTQTKNSTTNTNNSNVNYQTYIQPITLQYVGYRMHLWWTPTISSSIKQTNNGKLQYLTSFSVPCYLEYDNGYKKMSHWFGTATLSNPYEPILPPTFGYNKVV